VDKSDEQASCREEVLVAAAGIYAELLLADKLPWSDQTCRVVVACLTARGIGSGHSHCPNSDQQQELSGAHVAIIMKHLLTEVLNSPGQQQQRRQKLLLALYTNCSPANRANLVEGFLLGQFTKKELASEELVLPVLESFLSGSLSGLEGASEGAALLLSGMTASPKSITTLLQFFQVSFALSCGAKGK
jgi:hypothetical protein